MVAGSERVMTGPTRATVELVCQRDANRCAWCRGVVTGVRGEDWSIQHRRPRGMGGDRRPETNLPGNLVLVHGNGTQGCHGVIESRRAEAQEKGFLVPKGSVLPPAFHAIEHAFHGWVYLLDDGSISSHPPGVAA